MDFLQTSEDTLSLPRPSHCKMAGFREICGTFLKPRTSLRSSFLPSQVILLRRITTRLFIKGISFSSTELTFKEAFSKYGEVLEASIIRTKIKEDQKVMGM
ncbi:hypothetical protein SAY87_012996 [Trapa incisa]|uniref:RRM domain-containing protein n=1 Tax=Trapa incisa TaxID=236973 RepID=A0AAN7K7Y8_9MYRT|nr:hypothetical protein SAY87_012996 [Trapa incisa]